MSGGDCIITYGRDDGGLYSTGIGIRSYLSIMGDTLLDNGVNQ